MGLEGNSIKMYKCLVLECENSFIHVLSDDGEHLRIRKKGENNIGDTIYFFEDDIIIEEKNKIYLINDKFKYISSIAAIFIIFFLVNYSITNSGYALISLDINPSIEMEINKSGRVVKVINLNKDAKDLTSDLDLKGSSYENAIEKVLIQARNKGYQVKNHSVLIALAPMNSKSIENDEIFESIEANIKKYKEAIGAEVRIGSAKINSELSLGRSILQEEYPALSEDIRTKKIEEIFKDISDEDKDEIEIDNLEDSLENLDDDDDDDNNENDEEYDDENDDDDNNENDDDDFYEDKEDELEDYLEDQEKEDDEILDELEEAYEEDQEDQEDYLEDQEEEDDEILDELEEAYEEDQEDQEDYLEDQEAENDQVLEELEEVYDDDLLDDEETEKIDESSYQSDDEDIEENSKEESEDDFEDDSEDDSEGERDLD